MRRASTRRHGMIFVTALGIIIVLTSLLLVFAQDMRTELLASGNRLAAIQADAAERGAEQWALAQIDANSTDPQTLLETPAYALPVGSGYFWIIRPDTTQNDALAYGITDESGKLNLNTATPAMSLLLPGMTDEAADSIADWVDGNETARSNGAESSYYNSLSEPYGSKNSAMESPEELLLVKGITPELLYGYDTNHDGIIDGNESSIGGLASAFNAAGDNGCGIAPYVTVFSHVPTVTAVTGAVNVAQTSRTQLVTQTANLLTKNKIASSRVTLISNNLLRTMNLIQRQPGAPYFTSLGAYYLATTMTADEFATVFDQLTISGTRTIVPININTAPSQAIATLPGLEAGDVTTLLSARESTGTSTSVSWAIKALTPAKGAPIVDYLTTQSSTYSADIVAVSPNGRAFKRVRIVIDARQTPSKIVYRKDLTSLGWPLDEQIRTNLRAGQTLSAGTSTMQTGLN